MTPAIVLAAVLAAALVIYALLGGADYGGGIWSLLASGPRHERQRELVESAIGPIWEANHVWLIVALVLLFVGFPGAFARFAIIERIPLVVLVLGIVLRGSAFAFLGASVDHDVAQRRWGRVFAAGSALAPFALGLVAGSVAAGGAPFYGIFPVACGFFTVALFAYLAAAYLLVEAPADLEDDFRRRALVSAVAVFVLAFIVLALSPRAAPLVRVGLTRSPWTWPLQLATAAAALTAFYAVARARYRLARAAAAVQVALIVGGWAAALYPWILPGVVTVQRAAAPRLTLVLVLGALGIGALFLLPALYLLFRTFKGARPFSPVDRPAA